MIIIYVFLFFLLLSSTINMVSSGYRVTDKVTSKEDKKVTDAKVTDAKVTDAKVTDTKVDVKVPDVKVTDTNDIVEIITRNKKIYKNIEYNTNDIGKICNSSKDCSYGLSCGNNGKIKQCARIVPINKCNSVHCQHNKSKLGEMCGGFFLHEYICDDLNKLQCTTTNDANNTNGVCTQLM